MENDNSKATRCMRFHTVRSYFSKGRCSRYAWPGGYPIFAVAYDGEAICPDCVTKERKQIFRSTVEHSRDGWDVIGFEANYEDPSLFCSNCNRRIESAYAEDDA